MCKNFIEILNKHAEKIDDPSIFFPPEIPEKKIKNAIEKYATSAKKEDVIFLLDETVFGKADEGILMTPETLYAYQAFEGIKKIKINQIENIFITEGMISCTLHINDNKIIAPTQTSKSAMRLIGEMLREISECNKTKQQPINESHSIQDALVKLKSLFEMELISKEEYDSKRKEYISRL